MLIFPVKKEWYEKIKSGEKTVEYREIKTYWINRIFNAVKEYQQQNDFKNSILIGVSTIKFVNPFYCYFQLGYKPETRIKARIIKIENNNFGMKTDLKINKPVYEIHFRLEDEIEKE